MPRYGYGLRRWNAPDLASAVEAFLTFHGAARDRKTREMQNRLTREFAERRFAADEDWRNYARNREEAERMQPEITGGQQTGYFMERPGQMMTTGPYREEEYLPSLTPIEGTQPTGKTEEPKITIETPEGIKITGRASQVKPYIDQYGVKEPAPKSEKVSYLESKRLNDMATNAAKEAAGGDIIWQGMSPAQRQQWIDHYKVQIERGNQYPTAPQITGSPERTIEKSWWPDETIPAVPGDTTFMTPGQQPQVQPQGEDPLEAARVQLRAEGYTEEQIERAIQKLNAAGR